MKKAIWIVLTIWTFTSCGDVVDKERLPGRYLFSHWGKDTLDLKTDGTYYYRVYVDNKRLEHTGTWKLNSLGNEITFEDFTFLTEGTKGNWQSKLRTNDDEIHLMYASDENIYFKKIE